MFFAAYVGPSMNPTLREPEVMEIIPYDSRPAHVGDVVYFLPPATDQPVVHRIIRVTPHGISTCGDNNNREDPALVQPVNIKGRVVAAWRGQQRRRIAGGRLGRMTSRWFRWQHLIDRRVSPLLHPVYRLLSYRGLFARLLPPSFRPQVVIFRGQGQDQFQLQIRHRIIGRFDNHRHQWQIQRPFHLLVDATALPGQQSPCHRKPDDSAERRQITRQLLTRTVLQSLTLADGSHWRISAGNEEAAAIVSQLGRTMKLHGPAGPGEAAPSNPRRLLVQVDAHTTLANCYVPLASDPEGVVVCMLSPNDRWGGPFVNLVRLSLVFARESQSRGGVLVHGALAVRDGRGVILAAPGGTGKTTASNRLPAPWHSLSDDTTLVVRDPHGAYWAHPWPTWSRFHAGGPGGVWDVQNPVPLRGIFLLSRADKDRAERIGPGQAVSLLIECVRQASMFMPAGLRKDELRALYQERFDNLCTLARVIPTHLLHISLTGAFWQALEQALETGCDTAPGKPEPAEPSPQAG